MLGGINVGLGAPGKEMYSIFACKSARKKCGESQFSISEDEVKSLLQSKLVVNSPVTRLVDSGEGMRYLRQVNVGTEIGYDKFTKSMTSTMTVLSDKFGNLVTAFPGALR